MFEKNQQQNKILEMLKNKQITSEEAFRLIKEIDNGGKASNEVNDHEKPVLNVSDSQSQNNEEKVKERTGVCSGEIAVIGMSGRFSDAENVDEFWNNLVSSRQSVKQITRWSNEYDGTGSSNTPDKSPAYGAFLSDIKGFDPNFFKISESEAKLMDPQQRIFLMEAWKAVENAGYSNKSLEGIKCGVFVGCRPGDYTKILERSGIVPDLYAFTGNDESVLPGRISYFLNLKGPGIAVHTACSSSAVAIHLACESIASGSCQVALAGGVAVYSTPSLQELLSNSGMISPDGKCKTFDQNANGFALGEGAGVLVLKSVEKAVEDGDHIYGVICGYGINHDGKTNGITAPSASSQLALQEEVYERFSISPEDISYVEAHGTGTTIGDAIEVDALSGGFRKYTQNKQFCAIGSVKTNIGNALTAAGVISVIKVLMCLKNRKLIPSLNLERENELINFKESPFFVCREVTEWDNKNEAPLMAAVNAYAYSGTNAFLVIREWKQEKKEKGNQDKPLYLFPLSAKTKFSLVKRIQELIYWLENNEEKYDISDVSYTLGAGRSHFNIRCAVMASSTGQLKDTLYKVLKSEKPDNFFQGEEIDKSFKKDVKVKKELDVLIGDIADSSIDSEEYSEKLINAAKLYVKGYDLDFTNLFSYRKHERIALPTYPFDEGRYWVEAGIKIKSKLKEDVGQRYQSDAQIEKEELTVLVEKELIRIASDILKISEEEIDTDTSMSDLGFDSFGITEFTNKVNEKYILQLSPAVLFEYSTLGSFAGHIGGNYTDEALIVHKGEIRNLKPLREAGRPEIANHTSKERPETGNPAEAFALQNNEPIAIIGMSGIMPQSKDLEEFWNNLVNEVDMISEIPPDRWDWKELYGDPVKSPNKTKVKWGGFMKEVDKFDAQFFGLSPREAELLDPQHRIFMETVWKAIEDAGYKASDFSGTKTGIFVGICSMDYTELFRENRIEIQAQTTTGNAHTMLPNRISYFLNIHGPSEPIDTACSSSIVAIHRAIESMRNGDCNTAIVGGVNVILNKHLYVAFTKAGMLCEDGRCKTFDRKANGYVRGEGSAAVLLKPLSKAINDGDHIYAVIKGSAVNHGGKANSLTAPNPNAQAALIINAWRKAGVDPATATFIEAHGTGTSLGDPIEINGLKKAFNQLYRDWGKEPSQVPHCGIGAVKSNIGHLESAAGIAGLVKVLLAMKHGIIPANLNFKELNTHIDMKGSPFYIADKTMNWERLKDDEGRVVPRRAGISSFGFGGSNAHIVIEEYMNNVEKPVQNDNNGYIIVLSAKNHECLKEQAENLARYIMKETYTNTGNSENAVNSEKPKSEKDKQEVRGINLEQVAYTLQVGREPMEDRIAFVIHNEEELLEKLGKYTSGDNDINGFYSGNIKSSNDKMKIIIAGRAGKEFLKIIVEDKELDRISQMWVSGIEIDWTLLYENRRPVRASLPTYPFARERYWIPIKKDVQGKHS